MAPSTIPVAAAKRAMTDGEEAALLDVREHGQYGEGHPFFAVNAPFSVLEPRVRALVPRSGTRCLLLDGGDGVAERAAARLDALGYTDVRIVDGGAPAWAAAGHTLYKGVNVPSKSFGELVEHELGTRSLTARELKRMRDDGAPLVLLDGRSGKEHRKMTLPGARSCPNAELGHRLPALVEGDDVPVVVHCAGRTRSIIGAQTLALLDVPNPVYALENGTQGWRLAGFELEHGTAPRVLPELSADALERSRTRAAVLLDRYGVPTVDAHGLERLRGGDDATTYLFDVRSVEEFDAGHVPGAVSAPGGQLVQATDEKVAVRGARIVLCCDTRLRSAITAIWLNGMGHDARVLDVDASSYERPNRTDPSTTPRPCLSWEALPDAVASGARLLDVSRGMDHRAAHPVGAVWATRARLARHLDDDPDHVIVTGREHALVDCAVRDLRDAGAARVDGLVGGPDEWRGAGLEVESTPGHPRDADCIDHLFFVHDRHDGNLEASRRYLEWELGLVDQLDEQERSVLRPPRPVAAHETGDRASRH